MTENSVFKKIGKLHWLPVVIFILVAIAGVFVHLELWKDPLDIFGEDIYYTYVEGKRIIAGNNPYGRILDGNMQENDKYATYFPLAYLLSSLTLQLGLEYFSSWLFVWRVVFMAANIGIAYLIFHLSRAQNQSLLGIFGALFWLFNRWTLHVTSISHLDFIPLFLFLLSLSLIPRRFYLACITFGLSLAFKQIAIFALPLYLIWSWQTNHQNRVRHLLIAAGLISLIPLIVSIPFLIWSFEGFMRSILFSVTRYPEGHFNVPTIDTILNFGGIWAKLPMFLLLGLVYLLSLFKRVPKFASALLVMTIFYGFNSVLFRHYVVWFIAFIPLTILELLSDKGNKDDMPAKNTA